MKYELMVHNFFGKQLEVLQEIPGKGDKFPTIIMVPGFGVDLHEYGLFDEISDILIRNGFQTIRFNFEGIGRSHGKFVDMTVDNQAQQIKDIVKYAQKDRYTETTQMGILTQSFGGPTAISALPLPDIKTFVFMSPPAHPEESLAKYFKRQRGFNPEGISERERSDNRKVRIGPQIWTTLANHNFLLEIKKLTQPILFIQGTKDRKVSFREAQEYYDAVKSKKKLHYIYHGDHGFTREFRPKLLEFVRDWFNEQLQGVKT